MDLRLELDHLVVGATDLDAGVAHVEAALGVTLPPGGAHPQMATHNHLGRLGDETFLEVIAPDPANTPQRPRWYGLDHPVKPPRLLTYVLRTNDLDAALRQFGPDFGEPITASRGNLTWRFAVRADGALGFGGALPALIEWPRGVAPWLQMTDLGCSLTELMVTHGAAARIAARLAPLFSDPRVRYVDGPVPSLVAHIATPSGPRRLS